MLSEKMHKTSRIYIAGYTGLFGVAILRLLIKQRYTNLIRKSRQDFDLRNQRAVIEFFRSEKTEYVFLAAAKVGGINANNLYPVEFVRDNITDSGQYQCKYLI